MPGGSPRTLEGIAGLEDSTRRDEPSAELMMRVNETEADRMG